MGDKKSSKQLSIRIDMGLYEKLAFIADVFHLDLAAVIHSMLAKQLPATYEEARTLETQMRKLDRSAPSDSADPLVREVCDDLLMRWPDLPFTHDDEAGLLEEIARQVMRRITPTDPPLVDVVLAVQRRWADMTEGREARSRASEAIERVAENRA